MYCLPSFQIPHVLSDFFPLFFLFHPIIFLYIVSEADGLIMVSGNLLLSPICFPPILSTCPLTQPQSRKAKSRKARLVESDEEDIIFLGHRVSSHQPSCLLQL